MRLTLSILSMLAAVVLGVGDIVVYVRGDYEYERVISANWSLADKSSTITQKSEYVDKFVTALESSGLQGQYNAILFPTPDNSFDLNLDALRSLQWRLREIQSMNPSSFEYQTAIQQITQQEQGEANAMLMVFEGIWWKHHHFFLWDWVGLLNGIVAVGILPGLAILFLWLHAKEAGW